MHLTLTDDETYILREFLADHLPELKRQVAATDQTQLRHRLAQRQDLVERILEQLRAPAR
jgi:hypothetical protein